MRVVSEHPQPDGGWNAASFPSSESSRAVGAAHNSPVLWALLLVWVGVGLRMGAGVK